MDECINGWMNEREYVPPLSPHYFAMNPAFCERLYDSLPPLSYSYFYSAEACVVSDDRLWCDRLFQDAHEFSNIFFYLVFRLSLYCQRVSNHIVRDFEISTLSKRIVEQDSFIFLLFRSLCFNFGNARYRVSSRNGLLCNLMFRDLNKLPLRCSFCFLCGRDSRRVVLQQWKRTACSLTFYATNVTSLLLLWFFIYLGFHTRKRARVRRVVTGNIRKTVVCPFFF